MISPVSLAAVRPRTPGCAGAAGGQREREGNAAPYRDIGRTAVHCDARDGGERVIQLGCYRRRHRVVVQQALDRMKANVSQWDGVPGPFRRLIRSGPGSSRARAASTPGRPSPAAASGAGAAVRDLLAQHKQLGVLRRRRTRQQRYPSGQPDEHQVQQPYRHKPAILPAQLPRRLAYSQVNHLYSVWIWRNRAPGPSSRPRAPIRPPSSRAAPTWPCRGRHKRAASPVRRYQPPSAADISDRYIRGAREPPFLRGRRHDADQGEGYPDLGVLRVHEPVRTGSLAYLRVCKTGLRTLRPV
jgi:hypothetical protein